MYVSGNLWMSLLEPISEISGEKAEMLTLDPKENIKEYFLLLRRHLDRNRIKHI